MQIKLSSVAALNKGKMFKLKGKKKNSNFPFKYFKPIVPYLYLVYWMKSGHMLLRLHPGPYPEKRCLAKYEATPPGCICG